MKIRVDGDLCMGHGMCAARAHEVYELNDVGMNEMGEFEVPEALAEAARRGASACPERIITVAPGEAPAADGNAG